MKAAGPEERQVAAERLRRELAEITVDLRATLEWESEGGELRPRTPAEERKLPPLELPATTPAEVPAGKPAVPVEPAGKPAVPVMPAEKPAAPVVAVETPPPQTPADDCADLAALAEALQGCQRCKLSASRNLLVFGEGDHEADLLLVGEAPGYHEDRRGRPFVGPAGELLDKILGAIGIRREQVYICNIVKCRPPGNRDPQPDEVSACQPFVRRQIELINPKAILGLGRVASQTLLDTRDPVGKLRGRFYDLDGRPFLPTYHPAALLRDAKYKRPVWEDVQKLKARLEELSD